MQDALFESPAGPLDASANDDEFDEEQPATGTGKKKLQVTVHWNGIEQVKLPFNEGTGTTMIRNKLQHDIFMATKELLEDEYRRSVQNFNHDKFPSKVRSDNRSCAAAPRAATTALPHHSTAAPLHHRTARRHRLTATPFAQSQNRSSLTTTLYAVHRRSSLTTATRSSSPANSTRSFLSSKGGPRLAREAT